MLPPADMSPPVPKKLLVLLPITRTGALPERAVASLQPIAELLHIVASFNRPVAQTADAALIGALRALNASIIETGTRLNALAHGTYILEQCRRIHRLPQLQPTTTLCDDDELLLRREDGASIITSVAARIAIWGQYEIAHSFPGITYSPHAFYSSRNYAVTPGTQRHLDELEFARIGFERPPRIQGSITGLFAPYEAFRSAFRHFNLTRAVDGVKMENTILGWRGLSITEHSRPVARIYLHAAQAGRGLPGDCYRLSELTYRLHAVCNAPTLHDLATLRRAGFAPRWFLREITWALRKAWAQRHAQAAP